MAWLKKYFIIVIAFALLISTFLFVTYKIRLEKYLVNMKFTGSDKVLVRVKFEGCACGLDYPQYVIDSVIYTYSGRNEDYLNKNVYLKTSSKMQKSLLKMNHASGCYSWLINGGIKINGYGMHQLILEKVVRNLDENCLE